MSKSARPRAPRDRRTRRAPQLLAALLLAASTVCRAEPVLEEGLRQINGTALWIASQGEGAPILVVHGGPGFDHRYLLPRLADLATDHRLIFYDQRASGRSSADVDPETVTLESFMRDLDGVREALGLERVHLLGHSFGGMLAMQYAIRHPERLLSLILLDSSAASSEYAGQVNRLLTDRLTPERRERRSALLASGAIQRGEPRAIEELLLLVLSANFHDPDAVSGLHLVVDDDYARRSALLQGLQPDLEGYDIHDRLPAIRCPTLIVRGASEVLPRDATDRIAAAIAGSRQVELAECGHFPFVECPDELTAALRAFLDSLP